MALKHPWRCHHRKGHLPGRHARQSLITNDRLGYFLAMHLLQERLVIKRLHLRRTAVLEQKDHSLGLGPELGKPVSARSIRAIGG